jgi:sterol desaturase/sphingolipid hydroxylase (fatty acid hydroxylase superfamily)
MNTEATVRLGFFAGVFLVVSILEIFMPRRTRTNRRSHRWFANLTLVALNPISVRLLFPVLPVGLAAIAAERNWGLLNNVSLPLWLEMVIGVLALDLAVYLQHVLHHAIPLLWRLHMIHHCDLDFDLTTGVRFHPIEIVVSMTFKLAAVIIVGPPALAVLIFEVALNALSMFNHSNIHIPTRLDGAIRSLLVTPDMHRVHHSVIISETNSNYGFCLSWWDRLLGTYTDQPDAGHLEMTIGLSQFRDSAKLNLANLLILPFREGPGKVPLNRE